VNVCLISAPTANDFDNPQVAESDAVRQIAEHAPLGILSLAGVLEQNGLTPEIVDLNRLYYDWIRSEEQKRGEIAFTAYVARHFASRSYDFYGFSTICSSYPLTLRIAREVKRLYPDSTIALGGPQASVVDTATMNAYPFVDLIVRGEAEESLPAVLDALESKHHPSTVPGVTYRFGGTVMRNANGPLIMDLDMLPFPAFHLYPHMDKCSYLPLELGRGCPFACTFCSTNDFFRRRFRLKSPPHIVAEMRRMKDTYGIDTFDLVHDMFTVDRKRVVEFCEALLESGEKFYWGCSARTDCIDDELIELLATAGCRGIFFGIETGSVRLQKIIDKGLNLPEAADRIRTCDRFHIKTAVSLITGFPEEAKEDLHDTVDFFMDSLRYDWADPQLCILAPLADTPIYKAHKDELIFDDVISDMSFQGWKQDPEDVKMIEAYPEIFPNFYSAPAPHLDRKLIKELREFILSGMQVLRWLLVGLHQDGGDLLEIFERWREWRSLHKGPMPDENERVYYAQATFHREFVEFVRCYWLPERSRAPIAIATLADYEASFIATAGVTSEDGEKRRAAGPEEGVSADSIPYLSTGIHIARLDADYHRIVDLLREKLPIAEIPLVKVTLVTRANKEQRTEILQLSPASAALLELCAEGKNVRQIAAELPSRGLQLNGIPDEAVCIFGIEVLRREGLVELEATAEPAAVLAAAGSSGRASIAVTR
jgi:radical SAM superfamily enzyme YgiQ (UPF0313 family)